MRAPALVFVLAAGSGAAQAEFQLALGPAQARAFDVRSEVTTHVTPSAGTLLLGIPERFGQNGVGADPRPASTLAISGAWYFSDAWGLSLELGIPPRIEAQGHGVARAPGASGPVAELDLSDPALNPLASQRQWSPAAMLRYRFGAASDSLRPFLAAGVTCTWFSGETLNPAFEDALDQQFGQALATGAGKPGRTRAELQLERFWAPAASGGARWSLGEHWGLGVIAAWVPLNVDARLVQRAADGSVLADTRVRTRADGVVGAFLIDYRL